MVCDEQQVCTVHVARQDVSGAMIRFRQPVSPPVPLDIVAWAWLVYPADHPAAPDGPIDPLLVMVETKDGNRVLWGEVKLQDGQAAWAYGMDSPGGLGTFVQGLQGTGEAVLARGVWRLEGRIWNLQMVEGELYHFDQEKNAYVQGSPTPSPTWTPRP